MGGKCSKKNNQNGTAGLEDPESLVKRRDWSGAQFKTAISLGGSKSASTLNTNASKFNASASKHNASASKHNASASKLNASNRSGGDRTPVRFGNASKSGTGTCASLSRPMTPGEDPQNQDSDSDTPQPRTRTRPPWKKYYNSKNEYLKHEKVSAVGTQRLNLLDPSIINQATFENRHAPKPMDDSCCCPCTDCFDDDDNCNVPEPSACGCGCSYNPCQPQQNRKKTYCQNISPLCQNNQFSSAFTRSQNGSCND